MPTKFRVPQEIEHLSQRLRQLLEECSREKLPLLSRQWREVNAISEKIEKKGFMVRWRVSKGSNGRSHARVRIWSPPDLPQQLFREYIELLQENGLHPRLREIEQNIQRTLHSVRSVPKEDLLYGWYPQWSWGRNLTRQFRAIVRCEVSLLEPVWFGQHGRVVARREVTERLPRGFISPFTISSKDLHREYLELIDSAEK